MKVRRLVYTAVVHAYRHGGRAESGEASERRAAQGLRAARRRRRRRFRSSTSVTRTAVWVGDPVTYTVELTCAPKIDILADDLAAERLPLTGLELLGVEVERDAIAYPTGSSTACATGWSRTNPTPRH